MMSSSSGPSGVEMAGLEFAVGTVREEPNREKKPDRVSLGVEAWVEDAWECILGAREEAAEVEGVAK